jgi:hypothetical protein
VSAWHPIETAPLDGREVLTYRIAISANISVAYYDGEHWRVSGTLGRMALTRVTHWMPLPEPPRKPRVGANPSSRLARFRAWFRGLAARRHKKFLHHGRISYTWPRDDLQ